jgi:hypothetical protein
VTSPKVASNAITQAATNAGERYNAELKDWDNPAPTITDAEYERFRRAVGA